MPVFKKSKKPKESANNGSEVIDSGGGGGGQVKQLDQRVGMDCYRDFFTVKNYWKTIQRNAKKSGGILLYRLLFLIIIKGNNIILFKSLVKIYKK